MKSIQVLRLRRNLGHQRAIAVALAYVQQKLPGDAVVVMDADGEDRPEDIHRRSRTRSNRQILQSRSSPERGRRIESFSFKLFYACYRLLHRVLTGRNIKFGNFSLLPRRHLDSIVAYPELWNHYAAAVLKARLPYIGIRADRGKRLSGKSKMSFVGLVVHGLSALFASYEVAQDAIAGWHRRPGFRFLPLASGRGRSETVHSPGNSWLGNIHGRSPVCLDDPVDRGFAHHSLLRHDESQQPGISPHPRLRVLCGGLRSTSGLMSDSHYVGQELDIFAHARNWKRYWSSHVRPHLRGDVLEVGAGIGANTPLLDPRSVHSWVGLEPDAELAQRAAAAFAGDPATSGCQVIVGTLQTLQPDLRFDALLYIDVLEHIAQDKEELERAAISLKTGGRLIVLSPAHQWLYTEFDQSIGHVRRYDRASLSACSPEGCTLSKLCYLDSVGMLALLRKSAPPSPGHAGSSPDSFLGPVSDPALDVSRSFAFPPSRQIHTRCLDKELSDVTSSPMVRAEQESTSSANPEWKYEPWVLLAALTALYAIIVSLGIRRVVWYDELLTFDIANAKTIPQMWEMIRRLDFQTPLGYLLSRFSMKVLGQTPLGLRLPSILAFYVASVALFFYVRRKVGSAYAACAVLLLWVGQAGPFATEARTDASLLMFFAILLLSWEWVTTSQARSLALWSMALANLGMISAHIFGPLSLLPFLAAEAARFSRTRKPDFKLWAALLLPAAAVLLYLPLISQYQAISFPPEFQASLKKIPHFYYATISEISAALFFALCAALLAPRQKSTIHAAPPLRREEIVLLATMLVLPVLLIILLMSRHGAFWDRHAITTEAVIYSVMAILLGLRLGRNRYAGYAAAAVLLMFCLRVEVWRELSVPRHQDATRSSLYLARPAFSCCGRGYIF